MLDEIRALLAEGKAEEALYLIRKEEEMPYLPADFEQQLKRLKKEAVFLKADQKEERIRPLSQILGMLKGSSESQLAAASQISDYNLRECTEELREYLQKDPQPEASALIIDALAAQEINEEFASAGRSGIYLLGGRRDAGHEKRRLSGSTEDSGRMRRQESGDP